MVKFNAAIKTALTNVGIPTYYELFLDKSAAIPCISYIESANSERASGNTLSYSDVRYTLKIWSRTVADLVTYADKVDDALAAIGLRRISSNELSNDGLLCNVLIYGGLCRETHTTPR